MVCQEKFTMGKLKQISELEKFYFEAKQIRERLNLLIKDMQAMIAINKDSKPQNPVAIDPRTGKPF